MSTHSVAIPSLVLNPIVSSKKSIRIIPQNNSVEYKEKKTALQICVVGLGAQNTQDHLPALMASLNVEICAVVDSDQEKVFAWSQKLNVPGFVSVDQMLSEILPEAAVVAVPHDQYLPIIVQLANHGVHILKEKPLARSFGEASDIVSLVKSSKIKLMVAVQRRFKATCRAFEENALLIGIPRILEARYTLNAGKRTVGWRANKNVSGGGCLIDMGYHIIDLLIWYFGLPDSVAAIVSCKAFPNIVYEAEDTAIIIANYKQTGLVCNITISDCMAPKTEYLLLTGTDGSLRLERDRLILFDSNMIEVKQINIQINDFTADQLGHFVQVAQGRSQNPCAPEYHMQHMAFIEACYLSASSKKYIDPHDVMCVA